MEQPEDEISEEEGRLLEMLSYADRGVRRSRASTAQN